MRTTYRYDPNGRARLVKDGLNGLIVNVSDIDGLAAAIARLAASSELRQRFGQQARNDAKQYTYEQVGFDRALKLEVADQVLDRLRWWVLLLVQVRSLSESVAKRR